MKMTRSDVGGSFLLLGEKTQRRTRRHDTTRHDTTGHYKITLTQAPRTTASSTTTTTTTRTDFHGYNKKKNRITIKLFCCCCRGLNNIRLEVYTYQTPISLLLEKKKEGIESPLSKKNRSDKLLSFNND